YYRGEPSDQPPGVADAEPFANCDCDDCPGEHQCLHDPADKPGGGSSSWSDDQTNRVKYVVDVSPYLMSNCTSDNILIGLIHFSAFAIEASNDDWEPYGDDADEIDGGGTTFYPFVNFDGTTGTYLLEIDNETGVA